MQHSQKYKLFDYTCSRDATYSPLHFSEALNPFLQNVQCLLLNRPKNGGRGDQVLLKAIYQWNGKRFIHFVLVSNEYESGRKKWYHSDIHPTYMYTVNTYLYV